MTHCPYKCKIYLRGSQIINEYGISLCLFQPSAQVKPKYHHKSTIHDTYSNSCPLQEET